ncbi:hypothetical protein SVIOM342S_02844 [Streptomyces violaceorubidus]
MITPAGLAATPLGKAAGIVRDYVLRMYYVVDEVPRRQRLRLTPVLLGVEYLVYRVDSLAERNAAVDLDAVRGSDYEAFHTYKRAFEKVLRLLRAWNDDVAFLVDEAERFIRLENGTTSRGTVAREDVLAMVELRPTDVRLLVARHDLRPAPAADGPGGPGPALAGGGARRHRQRPAALRAGRRRGHPERLRRLRGTLRGRGRRGSRREGTG